MALHGFMRRGRLGRLINAQKFNKLITPRLIRGNNSLGPQVLHHPVVSIVCRSNLTVISQSVREAGERAHLFGNDPRDGQEAKTTSGLLAGA